MKSLKKLALGTALSLGLMSTALSPAAIAGTNTSNNNSEITGQKIARLEKSMNEYKIDREQEDAISYLERETNSPKQSLSDDGGIFLGVSYFHPKTERLQMHIPKVDLGIQSKRGVFGIDKLALETSFQYTMFEGNNVKGEKHRNLHAYAGKAGFDYKLFDRFSIAAGGMLAHYTLESNEVSIPIEPGGYVEGRFLIHKGKNIESILTAGWQMVNMDIETDFCEDETDWTGIYIGAQIKF